MLIFAAELRALLGWMDGGAEGNLEECRREVEVEEGERWNRQTIEVE